MIQKYIFIGFVLLGVSSCGAKAERNGSQTVRTDSARTSMPDTAVGKADALPPYLDSYTKADSSLAVSILQEYVPKRGDYSHGEMVLRVARRFIGVPYVAHTLDRNAEERLVMNLHGLDCTTYVETVTALVLCIEDGLTRFSDYVRMLEQVRYRGGQMSYVNRLHYFHWWLTDNERMGFVSEISMPDPPFSAVQTLKINYMSLNARAYDMLRNSPHRVSELRKLENASNGTKVRYIPKNQLGKEQLLRRVIHDGDIIAIVTSRKELDTSHLGFAVWHKDGLHLMNASSLRKNGNRVVDPRETLYDYMMARPSNIGIRVARIR